ncbi:hypothetical protein AO826_10840 [Xanthomonas phaseoli pv. manihotis]|nr:hypothetical protein AO826_10840 [Xanthomonas phaseoli pv. manihotis]
MLAEQNITIFGSSDEIVANLMQQAGKFCRPKTGRRPFCFKAMARKLFQAQLTTAAS